MDKLRAIRQWVEDGIEMGNRPDTMEDWDSDPNWHTQYYDHKTYDTQDWMRFLLEEYDRLERELAAANAKIERALAIPEESYYENMPPSAAMVAANDMREQFREVLTSTP
jgi:hypothetical protein